MTWHFHPMFTDDEYVHLAFSILHGTFEPTCPGGCNCEICSRLLAEIERQQKEEAARYYDEHYPPPGGLL